MNIFSYLDEKKPPKALCIILTIVFAPIGLWLLYANLTFDKTALEYNSIITKYYGYIILAAGVICLFAVPFVANNTGEENGKFFLYIIVMLMAWSGSNLFFTKAKEILAKNERVNKITQLLKDPQMHELEKMAASLDTTYKALVPELKALISLGFFKGAKIDENARRIKV